MLFRLLTDYLQVWLTGLFLQPFRDLHSLKNKGGNSTQQALRKVVTRTFIGSCATLASTVANLAATAALNGEQSWVCLMICNLESMLAPCCILLHHPTDIIGSTLGDSCAALDDQC